MKHRRVLLPPSGLAWNFTNDIFPLSSLEGLGLFLLVLELKEQMSAALPACPVYREKFESEMRGPRFAKLKNWHHGLSAQILNVQE